MRFELNPLYKLTDKLLNLAGVNSRHFTEIWTLKLRSRRIVVWVRRALVVGRHGEIKRGRYGVTFHMLSARFLIKVMPGTLAK